jgi:diguanylate cyclase (GGDEF)-like protein
VIALAAAMTALVVAILVGLATIRAHRRAESRTQRVLHGLGARVDHLAFELTHSLEQLERERRLHLALGELRADAGLPSLLASAADAVVSLTAADAAVVCLADDVGAAHVAARGIPVELASQPPVLWPPDGPRSVRLLFDTRTSEAHPLRTGLAVPLGSPAPEQSSIAVFWRDEHVEHGAETVALLESIARRVAPVLVRSQRDHHAHVAAVDSVTGLGARRTFHELLRNEVANVRRLRMPLTLLVVDVDDFRAVNERLGQLEADVVLQQIATAMDDALPQGGSSCRIGGDEFAAILPDCTITTAEALVARIQANLPRQSHGNAIATTVSAGITELRDTDDHVSVFERAKLALKRAKQSSERTSVVVMGYRDVRA